MKKEQLKKGSKVKKSMPSKSKGIQFSKDSQDFLEKANTIFGELVADFIKERLQDLPEESQSELIWHIVHYMYRDEILPTGDSEIDIKLSEVIEKLPFLILKVFRYHSRVKNEEMEKTSGAPKLAN